MELQFYWLPFKFFLQVIGLTGILFWIDLNFANGPLLGNVFLDGLASYTVSFALQLLYGSLLYPRLLSPLRRLPIVPYGYAVKMIAEKPRGKTPLKWVTAQPDVELFNSRGFFGESVLYPVGPAALKDVLSTNNYDFVKPVGLRIYLAKLIGYGLIAIEGNHHKEQRKAIHPSFNIKNIRALYSAMWTKTGLLNARIERSMREHDNVNVGEIASRFAFDIIGVGALSRDFNTLEMTTQHPLSESFSKVTEPQGQMLNYMISNFTFPQWLCRWFHPKSGAWLKRETDSMRKAVEKLLDDAKAHPLKEGDILSSIINDSTLTRTEIVDNMQTFIGAGHETSASSIIWACHLLSLAENLGYQDKLRAEVRAAFPTSDGLSDFHASSEALKPVLESCPYLNGICEEVLRLFPTVPATLRESIRTTSINNTTVPAGQLVVIMPWAINRNPRYWGSDADKLRPERWIDISSDGTLRANKHGGAPSNFCEATFLHGPRACIGRDFARSELKCALAGIFGRYQVDRMEGDEGTKTRVSGQVTIKPRGGLVVRMKRVEGW